MIRIKSLNFPLSVPAIADVRTESIGSTPLGPCMEDNHGFQHVCFTDSYDRVSVVGQSSLAEREEPGASALWIGLNATTQNKQKAAMHLKANEVKSLVAVLEMWLQTGKLVEEKEEKTCR